MSGKFIAMTACGLVLLGFAAACAGPAYARDQSNRHSAKKSGRDYCQGILNERNIHGDVRTAELRKCMADPTAYK